MKAFHLVFLKELFPVFRFFADEAGSFLMSIFRLGPGVEGRTLKNESSLPCCEVFLPLLNFFAPFLHETNVDQTDC